MEKRTVNEERIKDELIKKFPFFENRIRVQRERRIFAEMQKDQFFEVLEYVIGELGFSGLCAITGLDEGEFFSFIYHVSSDKGEVLSLKISVPRENVVIRTVTGYFPSAEIYERELVDLLGVKVEGLPEGERYPLPDNWPEGQHPLRKDFRGENLDNKEKK
jgi:Ni,Fe-hydrogenase III component G